MVLERQWTLSFAATILPLAQAVARGSATTFLPSLAPRKRLGENVRYYEVQVSKGPTRIAAERTERPLPEILRAL
jgi:hypothetical protein